MTVLRFLRYILLCLLGFSPVMTAATGLDIDKAKSLDSDEIPPLRLGLDTPPSRVPRKISLADAIALTINYQDEIKISQLEVVHQFGVVRQDAGPFDPLLDYTFTGTSFQDVQELDVGVKSHFSAWDFNSAVNLSKKTRLGTLYSLIWTIDQAKNPLFPIAGIAPTPRTDQYRVTFQVEQPLLRDFKDGLDTMTEKASYLDLRAIALDNLQNVSQRIFNTAFQYWEWVAAQKLMAIRKESVRRSSDLVKKTRKLIKKNQFAAADIDQPLRQLAQQKVDAIIARQNAYASLQELRFAMGVVKTCNPLDVEEWIGEDYPLIDTDIEAFEQQMGPLIDYAMHARFDILALAAREKFWELLTIGAYNNSLPKFNVFASVANTNFTLNGQARDYFSSMGAPKSETDISIGLHFSMPFYNDDALGLLKQYKARWSQSRYHTHLAIQGMIRDLSDAIANQVSLSFALEQANEALERSKALVVHEQKRLKGGFSTLFILIDFENRLTDAQIEQVTIYKQLLQNIARIRFLTSTIVNADSLFTAIALENLTSLPFQQ